MLWDRSMLEWPACRDSLSSLSLSVSLQRRQDMEDSPGLAGQGIGDGCCTAYLPTCLPATTHCPRW